MMEETIVVVELVKSEDGSTVLGNRFELPRSEAEAGVSSGKYKLLDVPIGAAGEPKPAPKKKKFVERKESGDAE